MQICHANAVQNAGKQLDNYCMLLNLCSGGCHCLPEGFLVIAVVHFGSIAAYEAVVGSIAIQCSCCGLCGNLAF